MQQRALEEFDGLARIRALVDCEAFVPALEEIFGISHGGPGRPAWDPLVMFRSILLGVMHSLSDHNLQFMLLDHRTFKRFAGLESDDQVPDQKTLWKFRDLLSRSGRIDELFDLFKATRAKALSDRQDELNRLYSKVRCRVEHVFGSITNEMPERHMRCIGKTRARTWIGLRNLCYNMRRLSYLQPSWSAA